MRSAYSNAPMNLPQRRREPALKTLLIMISVIALMFGLRLFYQPEAEHEGFSDPVESENSEK